MPSRKSEPSDTSKTDSRRSSLRRLSSLASIHTLNPFSRRRSNNNVNGTPSSTSNVSLTSSFATDSSPEQRRDFSSSQIFTSASHVDLSIPPPAPAQPMQPPMIPARRSSYVCLPDDPIGGMPRSKTFSNLPLPTRGKKPTNSLAQSKSHTRLPSALLPTTRLPSPRMSTRKHSITRLTTIDGNASIRKKLSRSDTEPLLKIDTEQGGVSLGCSTAFKENISLSPVRRLPSMDLMENKDFYGSILPSRTYASRHGWADTRVVHQPLISPGHTYSTSNLSLSQYSESGQRASKRMPQKYDSSPAYRGQRERAPTPAQPVQRWNSQPVLTTSSANKRSSLHGEIKQNRLMSTIPAPTPPPPKTPLGTEVLDQSKLKSPKGSLHLRQFSEQTPKRDSVVPSSARPRAQSIRPNAGTILQAETLSYWTGRFSTLNDKYRNEDLLASLQPSYTSTLCDGDSDAWTPKTETDKLASSDATTTRMRRAVEHLWYLCGTDEAKQSFVRWQKQLASALNQPDLAKPVGDSASVKSCALEMSLKVTEQEEANTGPPSSGRSKMKFMDKLWRKKDKGQGTAAA